MFNLKKDSDGNVAHIKDVHTSGFHYDLFEGGYIKPEDQLDIESAKKVRDAIKVIDAYEDFLDLNNLLHTI